MTTAQHAPLPERAVSTMMEARQLEDDLLEVMSTLQDVVERETALVRAGKVRDAMALDGEKSELSQRYVKAITKIKSNEDYLARATPELLSSLHRHHDVFRSTLKVNLTVLATAHAVSEGIVRGVNGELQRRNLSFGYTAAGKRATPNPRSVMPLSVSRSL
ncbi:nitrogenase molybdenum-iron protein alpha/beta subunit [Nitrobacteraceae bacterium AZCC 1564]